MTGRVAARTTMGREVELPMTPKGNLLGRVWAPSVVICNQVPFWFPMFPRFRTGDLGEIASKVKAAAASPSIIARRMGSSSTAPKE